MPVVRAPSRVTTPPAPVASVASPAQIVMQRMGNQGASAGIQRAQAAPVVPAKVAVSAPRDPLESEADVLVERVVSMGASGGDAQGATSEPTADTTQTPAVQRRAVTPDAAPAARDEADARDSGAAAAPIQRASAPLQLEPAAGASNEPQQQQAARASAGGGAAGGGAAGTGSPPPSAREAVASTAKAIGQRVQTQQRHEAPGKRIGSAQAAAKVPAIEGQRAADAQTVATLDAADASKQVSRQEFRRKLREAIQNATPQPKTKEEADRVVSVGATQASGALRGTLTAERDAAAGPMKAAANTQVPAQPLGKQSALESEQVGAPPAAVSAAAAVPAPLPAARLDYSADRGPTEQLMTENHVTQVQLQKGNEPSFGAALEARTAADQHEASVEARYRQRETGIQSATLGAMQNSVTQGLGDMHATRGDRVASVLTRQVGTSNKDTAERQRVTDRINSIKNATREGVQGILQSMETEASSCFEIGLKKAEGVYEATFEDAKGGVINWLTNWGDDWEKLIETSLQKARVAYLREVDVAIDQVADLVESKLQQAKDRVAQGSKEVSQFVDGLDASVKSFGEQALKDVAADFQEMITGIDERGNALVDKLTQQYKDSYERMSATEERLREANKSLWQRVYDATVGLVKKILLFKDMLLGILGRAVAVIWDILADPIGFLRNLVAGVVGGLRNFMANIGAHLKKGLMDWLFGALGGAGLKLPDTLDLQGIISIVLQVLGLTYANFRKRAVAIVGEPIVQRLEQAAEVFKILMTQGIGGLWEFIKDQLTNLKSLVLDAIFDFIRDRVIIAGITWVIGLLNPASAFFKACKAIYDIVMFFINRGSQIMALVTAVIDSVAAIAKGQIGTAIAWVENALARAIPVAIGFLAGLLGLGDISGTIRKTIDKAQAPVNAAIDWVIRGAARLVKTTSQLVGRVFGGKRQDPQQKSTIGDPGHVAMAREVGAQLIALQLPEEIEPAAAALKMQDQAKILEREYESKLQPGIKLRVLFTKPTADDEHKEIDFEVVIAPNDARLKFERGLPGYPNPVADAYGSLTALASSPLPDGKIREAHHCPQVEFADTLGEALQAAGGDLVAQYPDAAGPLIAVGTALTSEAIAGRTKLPAILVHQDTHRTRGSGSQRIHGSEIRTELLAQLTKQQQADAVRTSTGEIAVKPQGSGFERQIDTVAADRRDKPVAGLSARSNALRLRGKQILTRIYQAEKARAVSAVEVALSNSKKDGTVAGRTRAIQRLKTLIQGSWDVIIALFK